MKKAALIYFILIVWGYCRRSGYKCKYIEGILSLNLPARFFKSFLLLYKSRSITRLYISDIIYYDDTLQIHGIALWFLPSPFARMAYRMFQLQEGSPHVKFDY
jgi:hypothetical protein